MTHWHGGRQPKDAVEGAKRRDQRGERVAEEGLLAGCARQTPEQDGGAAPDPPVCLKRLGLVEPMKTWVRYSEGTILDVNSGSSFEDLT